MPVPLESDPLLQSVPQVDGWYVLPPVVLCSKLGQGGMGAVYSGHHLHLGIDVAVKCLKPGLIDRGAQFVERFQREANLAAKITHQNLVRIYDYRQAYGLHYLVMELVDGESARERIMRLGVQTEQQAAAILFGTAEALAQAHGSRDRIIHRDIKPDNIMVSHGGDVKLADLGIAKALDADETGGFATIGVIGTPRYMAPEQWEGEEGVGPQADIWALGATLYFLLVGDDAIRGKTQQQAYAATCQKPFPDVAERRPDLSVELRAILEKCVALNVEDRFSDASELAAALEPLVDTSANVLAGAATLAGATRTVLTRPTTDVVRRIQTELHDLSPAPTKPVPRTLSADYGLDPATDTASYPTKETRRSVGPWAALALVAVALAAFGISQLMGTEESPAATPATAKPIELADAKRTSEASAKEFPGTSPDQEPAEAPVEAPDTMPKQEALELETAKQETAEGEAPELEGTNDDTPEDAKSLASPGTQEAQPAPTKEPEAHGPTIVTPSVKPTADAPSAETPSTDDPSTGDSAAGVLSGDAVLEEDSVADESVADESASEVLTAGEGATESSVIGDSGAEDPLPPPPVVLPPVLRLTRPELVEDTHYCILSTLSLHGTVEHDPGTPPIVVCNGLEVTCDFDAEGEFRATIRPKRNGRSHVSVYYPGEDALEFDVVHDALDPDIQLLSPTPGAAATKALEAELSVRVEDANLQKVTFNGQAVEASDADPLVYTLSVALLEEGANRFIVRAEDLAGGRSNLTVFIERNTVVPELDPVPTVKDDVASEVTPQPESQPETKDEPVLKPTPLDPKAIAAPTPPVETAPIHVGADAPEGWEVVQAAKQGRWATRVREPKSGIVFRLVLAGSFQMGSPTTEKERYPEEVPHPVTLTRPFYLALTETTQAQYQRVAERPVKSKFKGADLPVDSVSWKQANAFCRAIGCELPTEAQWEYACRAGTQGPSAFGPSLSGEFVNFSGSSSYPRGKSKNRGFTVRADGSDEPRIRPNLWGFHHMHGNVFEWCRDFYHEKAYKTLPAVDPAYTKPGEFRVMRGGSWNTPGWDCRSAARNYAGDRPQDPSLIGFRCSLTLPAN